MTLPELRNLCVTPFPLSARRDPLMRSVEAMCITISTALIVSEIWVNGSFLTQKMEPQDVDTVVLVSASAWPGVGQQRHIFNRIARKDFTAPLPCDSFFLLEYPHEHQHYPTYELMRSYWIKQFCFTRTEELKGLAVIRTPIT